MKRFAKALAAIMLFGAVLFAVGCKKSTAPSVETTQVSDVTMTSATVGGFISSDGGSDIVERGVCWGKNSNPDTGANVSIAGQGIGSFSCTLTDLEPATTYYARAYALNSVGVSYGNQVSFITLDDGADVHYQITVSATDGGSATGGGLFLEGETCTVSATADSEYHFTNWTENDSVVSTEASYAFTVVADRTLVANFAPNCPIGAINGKFTINDNGDQVYFSQGNLQFIGSSTTVPYWKFADHQWEYIGENQISTDSNIDRDLFGWGTSGFNHGAVCFWPWSESYSDADYYAYGQETYNLYDQTGQADWGYNAIANGGNVPDAWRTLTNEEWAYVFNTRNTPSAIRYVAATVNDIKGIILLPDDWSIDYYYLHNPNPTIQGMECNTDYSINTVSDVQWSSLEEHGVVFLPAAGYRYSSPYYSPAVYSVGSYGGYWSATCYNSSSAYFIYFYEGTSYGGFWSQNRSYGRSVRLVCNVEIK